MKSAKPSKEAQRAALMLLELSDTWARIYDKIGLKPDPITMLQYAAHKISNGDHLRGVEYGRLDGPPDQGG